MSRNTDRPEAPRSPLSGRTRRDRRRTAPALTSLEDRKLLTGGFGGMAAAPMMMQQAPAQVFQAHTQAFNLGGAEGQSNPTLSFQGDAVSRGTAGGWGSTTHTDASGQDWIYSGANAQFGPLGSLIFTGGSRADVAPKAGSPLPGKSDAPTTTDSTTDVTTTDATTDATTTDDSTSTDATASSREELDAAFEKYHADVQAIQDRSEVTPKLLAALRDAQETIKTEATGDPDEALVTTLQDDAKTVLDSGTFTDEQQATLKADYTTVLQSAGVSDETIASFFAAQDAVKVASHVTADDLATLASDRQAIQDLIDARGDAIDGQAPGGFDGGMAAPTGFGGGVQQGGGFGGASAPGGLGGGVQQGGGFGSDLPGFGGDFMIPGGSGGPQGGSTQAVAPSGGADVAQQGGAAAAAPEAGAIDQVGSQAAPTSGPRGGFGGRQGGTSARSFGGRQVGGQGDRMTTRSMGGRSSFGGGSGQAPGT
ncbi:MAG: hypothetical protein BGO49_10375 [Planctomycetales bacterium 71-10]|nr:MAG: hypothetical protein BGO49_10375 [Planctomycetales bacterium 71-10]